MGSFRIAQPFQAAALALCVAAAGCAPLTEAECRAANWKEWGERDGITGNHSRLEIYAHQCGQFDIQPSAQAYTEAHVHAYREWERRTYGSECCAVR
jgi:hypothetical protein